jgi:hypothetical protein
VHDFWNAQQQDDVYQSRGGLMQNSIVRLKFNETQILQTQGSNICKLNYPAKSGGYNTPKHALGFIPVIIQSSFWGK